jgi:hypothetical protein
MGDVFPKILAWPVATSLAVHAGVALWLSQVDREPPQPADAAPPRPASESAELVEVDLIEETSPPPVATRGRPIAVSGGAISARSSPSTAGSPAAGTGAIDTGGAATGGPDLPPADRGPTGDQSGGAAVPSPRQVARSIAPELGPPPPPSPLDLPARRPLRDRAPRSEIVPDGKGGYRANDLTFRARIGRDGRVSIDDKPNFHARIALPGASDIARHLRRWSKDPYGESPMDERSVETHTVKIVDGGFDLTDWAMRASGNDPYYHRKKAFLDRTRAERARMARVDEAENLRDSVRNLRQHLRVVWSYRAWSVERRRRALFELWDECAESGSAAVVAAADRARATIEAFIRRNLPADHADGYPAAELTALNRQRSSKRRFAPYSPKTGRHSPKSGE